MARRIVIAFLACVALVVFALTSGVYVFNVWERPNPLLNPIAVTMVAQGRVHLASGQTLEPAGIRRRDDVSQAQYDEALRIVVGQGIVIDRDLADGRAMLTAEPRFYNWCGTSSRGFVWKHIEGWYVQCPVSEALVKAGYAMPDLTQSGLTERERWRIEGMEHLGYGKEPSPARLSSNDDSISCECGIGDLWELEFSIERAWKPPPE